MTGSGQTQMRQEVTESGRLRFIMTVPITWRPGPTILDRFKKKKGLEATREFVFDTVVVGKVPQIASRIKNLPNELYGDTPAELAIDLVEKHIKDMVYIVATASRKSTEEPTPELVKFIEMNFTFDMLVEGANIAMTQLQLDMFLNCLMIFKGTSSIINPKSIPIEQAVAEAQTAVGKHINIKMAESKTSDAAD